MIENDSLSDLLHAIARETGLVPRGDWAAQARRGLALVAERRGVPATSLVQDRGAWPSLFGELVDHLTVGETYFFRQSSHFDLLIEALAARLAADPTSTCVVLSAGCATGEEAYSIAIAVHARLGAQALARVRIVASDLSAAAIRRARAGVYGAWAFRDAPAWLVPRYFERREGAGAALVEAIRRVVSFEVGHVAHHAATLPPGSLDAVFFRNVGLYLSAHVTTDAYREFRRALRPGGLLFVAAADPRPQASWFVETGHESTSVYQARAPSLDVDGPAPSSRRGGRVARIRHASHLEKPRARVSAGPGPRVARPPRVAPPRVAPAAPPHDASLEVMRLADQGELPAALALATALLAQSPSAPSGYLVRAQISLADGNADAAVEDLRRMLFVQPEHRLGRYWYVLALQGAGRTAQALGQARALEKMLVAARADALVEDDETPAGQLLDAVRFLVEGMT